MADLTKENIINALKEITLDDGASIIEKGMVSEIVIANGKVYFALEAGQTDPEALEPLRQRAESAVSELEGVRSVGVTVTAERKAGSATPQPKTGNGAPSNGHGGGPGHDGGQGGQGGGSQAGQKIDGVTHVIAVASGKGGVGKSTTSVNLALALKSLGLKVGILDADVYGPSMPRLLGIFDEPRTGPNGEILALEAYGIKVMSMGFMVAEGTPVVWRGPMVMSALSQMMHKVTWAPLDVLVIDMPPGTGDVQLTIAQQTPLAGAVIVSTPQDLALIDARKGINMFGQVNVPILGIIENMSYFLCPSCGTRSELFGHGGAREEALKIGTAFLGEVPLQMAIRETSDQGRPIVASAPESEEADAYMKIARKVQEQLMKEELPGGLKSPTIVIE